MVGKLSFRTTDSNDIEDTEKKHFLLLVAATTYSWDICNFNTFSVPRRLRVRVLRKCVWERNCVNSTNRVPYAKSGKANHNLIDQNIVGIKKRVQQEIKVSRAENFRMVDIKIYAWSSLFLNIENNLILYLYPEKCIKFNQSERIYEADNFEIIVI